MTQRRANTCYHCREGVWERVGTGETTWGGQTVPEVQLVGVPLYRCTHCERERTTIPNPRGLQQTLKRLYVTKDARLEPKERRHLRKLVGWSVKDAAERLGTTETKVRRWESRSDGMSASEEMMLRIAVLTSGGVEDYEAHDEADAGLDRARIAELTSQVVALLQRITQIPREPIHPRVMTSQGQWEPAPEMA